VKGEVVKKLLLSWLCAALVAAPQAAGAEDSPPTDPPQNDATATATPTTDAAGDQPEFAGTIVVTAQRGAQEASDLPAAITSLDRVDVMSTPTLTFDGLLQEQVPGFILSRNGNSISGDVTNQGLHLRGTGQGSSSHTLVLLDGVPIVDAFGGWVAWGRIPTAAIERIEVVRTGNATAWGNLTLGGVVHVITRKPERREISLFGEAGNLDTQRLAARLAEHRGDYGFEVGGSWFETGGFVERVPEQRGPIDVPTSSEQLGWRARLTRELASGADLELAVDGWSEDRLDGTPLSPGTADALLARLRGQALGARESLWTWTLFAQETGLSTLRGDANTTRTVETPSLHQFDVPAESLGGSLEWGRLLYAHQLTAGADLSRVEGSTNEDYNWIDGRFTQRRHAGGEQTMAGIFLADVWKASPRVTVTAAGRFDRWESAAGVRTEHSLVTGELLLERRHADREESVFTPSVGVVFRPREELGLHASLFRGFRAPNLNELHRPFRTTSGVVAEANPALDPERSRGAEVGADYVRRGARLAVAAYWNEIDDPILQRTLGVPGPEGSVIEPCGFVPPRGLCAQRENLGQIRSRGFELDGSLELGDRARLAGSYAHLHARVSAAPHRPELVGKPLPQLPKHMATLRFTALAPGDLDLFLAGRYVSSRPDDDFGGTLLPSFVVFDLGVTRPLVHGLELTLAAENVLDREIVLRRNRLVELGSPRQYRFGLRYRWPAAP
jgi:outer membrane receptor protein involved in Fe transport